MTIKQTAQTLEQQLTQLRTIIVSLEADLSLGCLSTTPTQNIKDRLAQIEKLTVQIKTHHDFDASFMSLHSSYITIAKRKYL